MSTVPLRCFVCYCKDCQAFARFLERTDVLDDRTKAPLAVPRVLTQGERAGL